MRTGILVLEAIERVNRELDALTVIITHNAVMADMADRVIHFADGRVVEVRAEDLAPHARRILEANGEPLPEEG